MSNIPPTHHVSTDLLVLVFLGQNPAFETRRSHRLRTKTRVFLPRSSSKPQIIFMISVSTSPAAGQTTPPHFQPKRPSISGAEAANTAKGYDHNIIRLRSAELRRTDKWAPVREEEMLKTRTKKRQAVRETARSERCQSEDVTAARLRNFLTSTYLAARDWLAAKAGCFDFLSSPTVKSRIRGSHPQNLTSTRIASTQCTISTTLPPISILNLPKSMIPERSTTQRSAARRETLALQPESPILQASRLTLSHRAYAAAAFPCTG